MSNQSKELSILYCKDNKDVEKLVDEHASGTSEVRPRKFESSYQHKDNNFKKIPKQNKEPQISYYYYNQIQTGYIVIDGGDSSARNGLRDVLRNYLPRIGYLEKGQIFEIHGLRLKVIDKTRFEVLSYISRA